MSRSRTTRSPVPRAAGILALLAAVGLLSGVEGLDTAAIDQATGLTGTMSGEHVYKVAVPRSDVAVTVDGTALPPFAGLTSWAAFQADPQGGAMLMGDVVLFEDEIDAAMGTALDHGLAVTALHNHFVFDTPRVYFMHIGGTGPTATLAAGVHATLDAVHALRTAHPQPRSGSGHPAVPSPSSIAAAPLAEILGTKPMVKDGMAKFVIGRSVAMPCGCQVGADMGVNTWAAFLGSDAAAVVDGDFAATAAELQGVLKALHGGGIHIVAIHSHMADETPRIIFLHYWGAGPAADLARTVHAALAAQSAATRP